MLIMSKSVMTESFSKLLLIKQPIVVLYCTYEQRHEPLSTIKLAWCTSAPSPPIFSEGWGRLYSG